MATVSRVPDLFLQSLPGVKGTMHHVRRLYCWGPPACCALANKPLTTSRERICSPTCTAPDSPL